MATLSLFVTECQLASIRQFIAREGGELGLDESAIYDLQLAVDEACANSVEHGYGGEGGKIEISIEPTNDGVQVIVRDWGHVFDPAAVSSPNVSAPLEQRPLGGLGLFLMQQVMDEVRFEFDAEKGNTLTMVKQRRRKETQA